MRLAFDIEADGIRRASHDKPQLTKVHCLVTQDVDTDEVRRYWDAPEGEPDGSILEGAGVLQQASLLIAHNGLGYDGPVLDEFFGATLMERPVGSWWDTNAVARLHHPKVGRVDNRNPRVPKGLRGRHSLEAWGHRLGILKGEVEKATAFLEFSPELVDYCMQDVRITAALYRLQAGKGWPQTCLDLEHRFARPIADMMHTGFPVDYEAMLDLEVRVEEALSRVDAALHSNLGARREVFKGKTRPRDLTGWALEGEQWARRVPLNLNSDQQVVDKLTECYGWEPELFTPGGGPQFDEKVVAALPESVLVRGPLQQRKSLLGARRRLLGDQKKGTPGLIGHSLQREDGSWWVHHFCSHNGARTGRCTHSHPNVNFPRVTSPWGPEFRGLVRAPEGKVIMGCDMSGVDARMIAHYLAPHDNGSMVGTILSGDLHSENRSIMAEVVPDITRSVGKNVFYAVCYGAKARRVGLTAGGFGPKVGGKLRAIIRERVLGLDTLIRDVERTAELRGWLRGLDGRVLVPDAAFSALNTLAQGAAAVVMKEATALITEWIRSEGYDAQLILHVHDEGQILCNPEDAEAIGAKFVRCIVQAGEIWGVRCPLDGEYKVGQTWAETH